MKRQMIILGVLAITWLSGMGATLYVSPEGSSEAPYSTLGSAARVLQDAAEIAKAGDEILVAPGVYTNGGSAVTGTLTNRVTVPQDVTLRSLEGAEQTVIRGIRGHSTNSVRCVYLARGASLIGFKVTHGGTRGELEGSYHAQAGGGVFCEELAVVRDCIIVNSTAYNYGGGVYGGSVSNCVIAGNWALRGGGVAFSDLVSCVVVSNSVSHLAGGVYRSEISGCTVSGNLAGYGAGGIYETRAERSIILGNEGGWIYPNHRWGTIKHSCTHPLPERGVSNITSRVEAEKLGYGAPTSLLDSIPKLDKLKRKGNTRVNRGEKRLKALGIEPVPGDLH